MRDIETRSALGLMTLLALPRIGPVTALGIANAFPTFGDMIAAAPEAFKGVAKEPVRRLLTEDATSLAVAADAARREIDAAGRLGARVIGLFDDEYPGRLTSVRDRPLILYASGDLACLSKSVACVGTREPSSYGEIVSDRMTTMLASSGWTIVSGLARGVDAIVHEAALKARTPTVAVLGSGIDIYQSKSAVHLLERILDAGGAVLTEQPLGREADPASFVQRNRIQSGVAAAVFVMQCNIESGTMHTIRYALHQGRPIFAPAVPERFRSDAANDGIGTMLRVTGAELARHLVPRPSEHLLEILEGPFRDRPVASAVLGRDDYPRLLGELETLLESTPMPLPAASRGIR